jgi:transglutaminase-like putative cysteine protease
VSALPLPAEAPVTGRRYSLVHRTEYTYDDEVGTSYGRAHLIPRHGGGQQRLSSQVVVDPAPDELREHTDFFGNRSVYFAVTTTHTRLSVTADSVVEVNRPAVDLTALGALGWEEVRDRLANRADLTPDLLEARPFLLPSPMIARSEEVAAYAAGIVRPGLSLGEIVTGLTADIHDEFAYVSGSTSVRTTLAELLIGREGVCQDFAHLAVACLRSAGLAARYVSGYLETRPPPGKPRLQGADASHAWASVFAPGVGWVDFDPTNRQFIDDRYVIAALGRDYGDVPPLRGVIYTESKISKMRVAVDLVPSSDG